jgi:hypothetical protein
LSDVGIFYGFKTAAKRAGIAGSFPGSGDKKHTYLTDCADPKSITRNRTAVHSLRYLGTAVQIPGCTSVCTHTSVPWCVYTHLSTAVERYVYTHTALCTCVHTVLYTRILTGVPVLIRDRY